MKALRRWLFGNDVQNTTPAPQGLTTIPPDIVSCIFAFLTIPCCGTISSTCKGYNTLNNTEELWADREKKVMENCGAIIAMDCLPCKFQVSDFSVADQFRNMPEHYRLICRIMLTSLIVLPSDNAHFLNSADTTTQLHEELSILPGKLRSARVYHSIHKAALEVEEGGWIFLTDGSYSFDEYRVELSKNVNFLGRIRQYGGARHTKCCWIQSDIDLLIGPGCAVSINCVNMEYRADVGKRNVDLRVPELPEDCMMLTVKRAMPAIRAPFEIDWGKWSSLKRKKGRLSLFCVQFCWNYHLVISTDAVEIFLNECLFHRGSRLLTHFDGYFDAENSSIPFISRGCWFMEFQDERLLNNSLAEFFRIFDRDIPVENASEIELDSLYVTDQLCTIGDLILARNLEEELPQRNFPYLADKALARIVPTLPLIGKSNPLSASCSEIIIQIFYLFGNVLRVAKRDKKIMHDAIIIKQIQRTNLIDVALQQLREQREKWDVVCTVYLFMELYANMAGLSAFTAAQLGLIWDDFTGHLDSPREWKREEGVLDRIMSALFAATTEEVLSLHKPLIAKYLSGAQGSAEYSAAIMMTLATYMKFATSEEKAIYATTDDGINRLLSLTFSDFPPAAMYKWISLSRVLSEKTARNELYRVLPSLDIWSKIKAIRCLSVQKEIEDVFWSHLSDLLHTIQISEDVILLCDCLLCLLSSHCDVEKNSRLSQVIQELLELGNRLRLESQVWLDTIKFLHEQNTKETCPALANITITAPDMHISMDGRSAIARFDKIGATAIVSHPVKTGRWCFECQLVEYDESYALAVGWCTQEFQRNAEPKPELGACTNSWALHLSRGFGHAGKWTKHESDIEFRIGGIIQLCIDCDSKEMWFDFDGECGTPVPIIDFPEDGVGLFPAFTLEGDNELRFNFAGPFKHKLNASWTDVRPYSESKPVDPLIGDE